MLPYAEKVDIYLIAGIVLINRVHANRQFWTFATSDFVGEREPTKCRELIRLTFLSIYQLLTEQSRSRILFVNKLIV